MSGHGGKRPGAGRPRKWSFDDVLRVGQDCEQRWREEKGRAFEAAKLKFVTEDTSLQDEWIKVNRIPINRRQKWHNSDDADRHRHDIEVELSESDDEAQPPSRVVTLSAKPPKGTRRKIIEQVAEIHGLTSRQVDNLWQEYRRFEAEEPPKT